MVFWQYFRVTPYLLALLMCFFLLSESSWCEIEKIKLELRARCQTDPQCLQRARAARGNKRISLKAKCLSLSLTEKFKENLSKLKWFFFFSTRMKMDAPGNFTWIETAQRGNAFSFSRGVLEISVPIKKCFFFFFLSSPPLPHLGGVFQKKMWHLW